MKHLEELHAPQPLSLGSRVAVVAPAGPFKREWLFRGLAWLRLRYDVRFASDVFEREGYLAGSDERRGRELTRAMLDPDVDAIFCARGGYGVMRIVADLPWEVFAAKPKWICGFSDITALHVMANARGIASLHSPNGTGVGACTPQERLALIAALEGSKRPVTWTELEEVHPGSARGPIVGGNLALVGAMAAGGALRIPEGAIVALEDVTERPYRVDRMLTSLLLGGHLTRASAIVFGGFTQCDPGEDGVTIDQVLHDRTARLGIPVVKRARFGHDERNMPFVLGQRALLSNGTLTLNE